MQPPKQKLLSARNQQRKRIDWRLSFIDLLVVFVGITLAFMINRAYENYKDGQLEFKYLSGFQQSLQADADSLKGVLEHDRSVREHSADLMQMLRKRTVVEDSALLILARMSAISFFTPQQTTYQSIKQSGNLNLISDYRLREQIIRYYEKYDELKLQQEFFFRYVADFLTPFFYENIDLMEQKIINKKALATSRFKNLISGYSVLLNQNIAYFESALAMSEELLEQLDETMKGR